MDDIAAKNRLIVLAYIGETEPVPYALLVTLILSSLSMDYFAFQDALSGVLEGDLVLTDRQLAEDASGHPRTGYRLSKAGRQVLDSLQNQLRTSELKWLQDNAPHYTKQFYENDLTGASYRLTDDGYMVSLGKTSLGHFDVQFTFRVEDDMAAKKAVARFQNAADGLSRIVRDSLLGD